MCPSFHGEALLCRPMATGLPPTPPCKRSVWQSRQPIMSSPGWGEGHEVIQKRTRVTAQAFQRAPWAQGGALTWTQSVTRSGRRRGT